MDPRDRPGNQPFPKRTRWEGQDAGPPRFQGGRSDFGRQVRGTGPEVGLDEDLQTCLSFDRWKQKSSENETVEQYKEFVRNWVRWREDEFANRHWREDWFLERYDPVTADERLKERIKGAQQRAESIKSSDFVSLSKTDHEEGKVIIGPELHLLSSEACAHIPHIPPSLPRSSLEKTLMAEGAQALLLSEVNKSKKRRDLGRRGTVIFETSELAKEALSRGTAVCTITRDPDGVFCASSSTKDDDRREVSVKLLPYNLLPNRLLPQDATLPDRQAKDKSQALACAEMLDTIFDIPHAKGVRSVIQERPSEVSEFDATIQYLRFVHFYCYYSASLCRDYGELVHRSAAPFLRPIATTQDKADVKSEPTGLGDGHTEKEEDDEGEVKTTEGTRINASEDSRRFFESVDNTAHRILNVLSGLFRTERDLVSEKSVQSERASTESLNRLVAETMIIKGSHAYCTMHDKLFENETFYRKHLINFHSSEVRAAQRSALKDMMMELYRHDEDKPLNRYPRFVDDVLKGTFVPFDESTRRFRHDTTGARFGGDSRGSHQDRRFDSFDARDKGSSGYPTESRAPPANPTWRYRDPDAPKPEAAAVSAAPRKLQYRTRVNNSES